MDILTDFLTTTGFHQLWSADGLILKPFEESGDLSKAVENISENYHDDYVFKRYLQDKWNEVLQNAKPEDGAAAATV